MDKYTWFQNHEGHMGYTVAHTENDIETLIAITDSEEKAHLIATTLNQYREPIMTKQELDSKVEELLKPYYKQNKGGLQEWIDYEDAHKVVSRLITEQHLTVQLYDGAIMQFKEADTHAHDLDRMVTAKQNEITRLHNLCQEHKDDINKLIEASKLHREAVVSYDNMVQTFTEEVLDLRKQVGLKDLSNIAVMLENRELTKWKEEAMIVMRDIPAIGKSIGVPLGETIHDKILPYITTLQASFKDRVLIIEKQLKEKEDLFPGAFLWWVHINGWHKHSSGEYYYKSKDFHQWPPDEATTIEDLKVQFKALYNL